MYLYLDILPLHEPNLRREKGVCEGKIMKHWVLDNTLTSSQFLIITIGDFLNLVSHYFIKDTLKRKQLHDNLVI